MAPVRSAAFLLTSRRAFEHLSALRTPTAAPSIPRCELTGLSKSSKLHSRNTCYLSSNSDWCNSNWRSRMSKWRKGSCCNSAGAALVQQRRYVTAAEQPDCKTATAASVVHPAKAAAIPAKHTAATTIATLQRSKAKAIESSSSAKSYSTSAAAAAPDELEAYHAGLLHTAFTHDLHISKDSPVIPIFRILNYDGKLADGWKSPLTHEEALETYEFMVKLSVWDSLFYNIQRQGRISFYIQNEGEEALQVGVGKSLSPKDHLFCQYRELGVLLLHGFSDDDVLDQLFSRRGDESKGRQMPISYSKRNINLHTICTPLTTQVPHAAGAGYAFKVCGDDCISVAFFGEGAASEGDFHAAMNFAATLKSHTLFVCRNNGYAISTPVCDQYAGDGIAIRGLAYGMQTVRVDGNDVFASLIAAKRARELILEQREPVLIEFMTYRAGHHSTSDDSFQYRPQGELEKWNVSGVHPIARLRRYLENHNLWTDQQEQELRKSSRSYMLKKLKDVEKHKRWPIVEGMFADVYDKEPWHLREQREEFTAFLERNKSYYPQIKEYEAA